MDWLKCTGVQFWGSGKGQERRWWKDLCWLLLGEGLVEFKFGNGRSRNPRITAAGERFLRLSQQRDPGAAGSGEGPSAAHHSPAATLVLTMPEPVDRNKASRLKGKRSAAESGDAASSSDEVSWEIGLL